MQEIWHENGVISAMWWIVSGIYASQSIKVM
jgi:hypothetical protein